MVLFYFIILCFTAFFERLLWPGIRLSSRDVKVNQNWRGSYGPGAFSLAESIMNQIVTQMVKH